MIIDFSKFSWEDLEQIAVDLYNERAKRMKIRVQSMPAAVITGDIIADIKAYRATHGYGLMESKAAVEAAMKRKTY